VCWTDRLTHIRLLNKRLTDRNLNNEIVNIVVTVQSLINVTNGQTHVIMAYCSV